VAQRKLKKLPSKYKMSIESCFAPEVLVAESAAHYGEGQAPVLFWRDDACGAYLYKGDSLLLMEQIARKYPDGLFDLIFADPPYFLSNGGITCKAGKMVSVDKGAWDRLTTIDQMHEFNRSWLSLCKRVLTPNGTIFVSGTSHVIHSIGFAMQQLEFKILNDITWVKPNPPPNLSCRYFTHASETILWAAKNSKSKHCFNYAAMRDQNFGKQMKSVWTLPAPNGEEKGFGKHPTQKPVPLLERIVIAASNEGDFVFDPFAGSSTTGVAAIGLGRRFVGCELDESYLALSVKRLERAIKEKGTMLCFGRGIAHENRG
jgi:site-specific DNA-methyltransferase (adenine-specific)